MNQVDSISEKKFNGGRYARHVDQVGSISVPTSIYPPFDDPRCLRQKPAEQTRRPQQCQKRVVGQRGPITPGVATPARGLLGSHGVSLPRVKNPRNPRDSGFFRPNQPLVLQRPVSIRSPPLCPIELRASRVLSSLADCRVSWNRWTFASLSRWRSILRCAWRSGHISKHSRNGWAFATPNNIRAAMPTSPSRNSGSETSA